MCIYFKTKWTNQLKYCPSLPTTFSHFSGNFWIRISKKMSPVFEGDPILEPIFDFCERNEPVTCCILRNNQSEGAMSGEYSGCGKTSHLSVSKYFFTTSGTEAERCVWRRTLSYLCYSSRFSRNANESIVADTDRNGIASFSSS